MNKTEINQTYGFEKILGVFNLLLQWSSIVFLFLQVTIVVLVVAGRFILNKTPVWGEETALLNMVWLSLFSAVIAEMDSAHIQMNLIDKILPLKIQNLRNLVFNIMNAVFALVMIINGFKLAWLTKTSIMPGSRFPVPVLYLSVPISSIFLFLTITKKISRKEP